MTILSLLTFGHLIELLGKAKKQDVHAQLLNLFFVVVDKTRYTTIIPQHKKEDLESANRKDDKEQHLLPFSVYLLVAGQLCQQWNQQDNSIGRHHREQTC